MRESFRYNLGVKRQRVREEEGVEDKVGKKWEGRAQE